MDLANQRQIGISRKGLVGRKERLLAMWGAVVCAVILLAALVAQTQTSAGASSSIGTGVSDPVNVEFRAGERVGASTTAGGVSDPVNVEFRAGERVGGSTTTK